MIHGQSAQRHESFFHRHPASVNDAHCSSFLNSTGFDLIGETVKSVRVHSLTEGRTLRCCERGCSGTPLAMAEVSASAVFGISAV
eukprot:symbB.v1.2.002622.t1/scaffold139.1/size300179/5